MSTYGMANEIMAKISAVRNKVPDINVNLSIFFTRAQSETVLLSTKQQPDATVSFLDSR
jgi:hypothetical protein